jgi:hypothetical protein
MSSSSSLESPEHAGTVEIIPEAVLDFVDRGAGGSARRLAAWAGREARGQPILIRPPAPVGGAALMRVSKISPYDGFKYSGLKGRHGTNIYSNAGILILFKCQYSNAGTCDHGAGVPAEIR